MAAAAAAAAAAATKKKAQPSRKGKKAWRKNVDMTEVEEGQEELRSVERQRGHTNELKDEELFTIDTTGDEKVRHQIKSNSSRNKSLKVDEILATRSAVTSVRSKNPFKKPEMTDKLASRGENKKVGQIAKRKATEPSTPAKKQKVEKKSYDLWGDEPVDDTPVNDFIPAKVKPKKPKSEKPLAVTHIEAVTVPEGGASYNPSAEEHQQLLIKANEVEERKAEALAKLQEQLSYREELNQLADEVTAGQHASEEEEEEEDEEEEEKEQDEKKKKQMLRNGGRKTRAERNRQHRLACERVKKKIQNQEKLIRQQIDKLKQIEVELDERHEAIEKLTGEKSQRKLDKEKQGKAKLSRYVIPELPIDFQLTEELSETLRQLKPEGSIFRDRYHSLQQRNIIETRVKVTPGRKYKLKEYEKRAYKNYDLNEEIKKKRSLGKK